MHNNFKKIIFSLLVISLFANSVFAQATTTSSKYANDTILTEANRLCTKYTGFQSVYETASSGGGGSVPVDLTQLRPVLESINRNAQLTANELRNVNTLKYCEEYVNMAKVSNKLASDAVKQLKTLADNCSTDKNCLLKRVYEADIQKELELAQKNPIYGREISKLILTINIPKPYASSKYDYAAIKKCNDAYEQGRNPVECLLVPKTEEIIKQNYYEAEQRVQYNQQSLENEFTRGNGLIASRPCTATASGKNPAEVKFYEADCISYHTDPLAANLESYKQIIALPYTQAYSPSSVLSNDANIDNINIRVREGNIGDPDISSNFGSISGGGTNPITGVGGTGGTGGDDLATLEASYNKLVANLKIINDLYEVGKLAYASTTSACRVLPVQTRSSRITELNAAQKTYTDYKDAVTKGVEAARKTPKESHTNLITKLNFDLRDKVNQELINKVYEAIKKLLQICADANK